MTDKRFNPESEAAVSSRAPSTAAASTSGSKPPSKDGDDRDQKPATPPVRDDDWKKRIRTR